MKNIKLPTIDVGLTKELNCEFKVNEETTLNIVMIVGFVDFDISGNCVCKFINKALVRIIQDQKYIDFLAKDENEFLKNAEISEFTAGKYGLGSNEGVLLVSASDLFIGGVKYSDYAWRQEEKTVSIPYIKEGTNVMIHGYDNMYKINKSSFAIFNFLNGNVSYNLALDSLISDISQTNISMNDISVVF